MIRTLLAAAIAGSTSTEGDFGFGLPGSSKLLFGNMDYGYFGTVPASEFLTDTQVLAALGLSTLGTLVTSAPTWFKFALNGKVIFYPTRPLRKNIRYTALESNNLVYGREISVLGKTASIRLLTGTSVDPATTPLTDVSGGEWDLLMYPIASARPEGFTPIWDNKTNSEMLAVGQGGVGTATWVQGDIVGSSYNIYRGHLTLTTIGTNNSTSDYNNYGWRPAIEFTV